MSNQYNYQYVEPPSSDLLIILTAAPHSLDTLVIFGSTAFSWGYCIYMNHMIIVFSALTMIGNDLVKVLNIFFHTYRYLGGFNMYRYHSFLSAEFYPDLDALLPIFNDLIEGPPLVVRGCTVI